MGSDDVKFSIMDSMNDVRGPDIDVNDLIEEDNASFDFIFTILRFIGIRTRSRESLGIISYIILWYCTVSVGLQLVDFVASSDLENKADHGKFFAACFSALTQYYVFIVKSEKMEKFHKLAVETNTFMLSKYKFFYELDEPMAKFKTTQNSIWSSYKRWYVGILITYLFTFIFANLPSLKSDSSDDGNCYGRQSDSIWKFFDCDNPVNFFLIFIFQDLVCGTIFLHVLWGFAAFRINVTTNLISQVRFLHNFIEKIGVRKKPIEKRDFVIDTFYNNNGEPFGKYIPKAYLQPLTSEAIHRQLEICVKFHSYIQEEQDILNDIFSAEVLVEFVCFTFLNCLTIFQAFSERKPSRLLNLAVFLCFGIGYLYSICDMGSTLRFECEHLTRAAYQCKWCTFGPSERKTIVIMIHKAQRTKYLRGGKVFDISVQTFVQLVRMSYSILLFLFNLQTSNPN